MSAASPRPYGDHAGAYRAAGWSSPIPVGNPGQRAVKQPVPRGFTGRAAASPTDAGIDGWCRTHAPNNIALHLTAGIIGIDIDAYPKAGRLKRGDVTIARLEAVLGKLPPTISVTSRGPGVSRIRFYRVRPEITDFAAVLDARDGDDVSSDVEVIQAKHRYTLVWPSVHDETGEQYRWYRPDGDALDRIPRPEEAAELPPAWVEELTRPRPKGLDKAAPLLAHRDVDGWLAGRGRRECRAVRNVREKYVRRLRVAGHGSRYDTARDGVMALVRLSAEGHRGVGHGLDELRDVYAAAVGGERRDPTEWQRSVVGAVSAVRDSTWQLHSVVLCPPSHSTKEPNVSHDEIAYFLGLHDEGTYRPPGRVDDEHEQAVAERLNYLRVDQEARERLAAERASTVVVPTLLPLSTFLEVEDADPDFRIEGLWPTGGRIMLSAQYKAGKTTLMMNCLRALADGKPFLDRYEVRAPDRVVYLDFELGERLVRKWLRDQGIDATDRIDVMSLRGKAGAFDILSRPGRERWARRLDAADVLVIDPLRPLFAAHNLDENHDAGRLLDAIDALLDLAGIAEAVIVHHMGHTNERARGDSQLRDWPDAEWKLVRDGDDSRGRRYFSAYGRDVDVPEQSLDYDDLMRRISAVGGSRIDLKTEAVIHRIVDVVTREPGCSQNALEKAVGGNSEDVRRAAIRAHSEGRIRREKVGSRWIHSPPEESPRPPRPTSSRRTDDTSSTSSKGRGVDNEPGKGSPRPS